MKRTRNKLPQHFFCKMVPNPYQFRRPTFRNITDNGVRFTVDLSDYVGHYYFFGFKDLAQERLFQLCQPDFIVLDIGANIGFTLLKLSQLANNGKVIGFEPDPYNFSVCSKNIEQNNFRNALVLNVGLGCEEGIFNMEVRAPSNRGGNRVTLDPYKNGIKVHIKKLDEYMADLMVDKVHLIKIDVEGYELKVLKGAEKTLKTFQPILFIELDNNNLMDQADSAGDLIDFLIGVGYKSFIRAETGETVNIHTNFSNCHFDIIVK